MSELGLARYDAMCQAIAECHKVDEAKEIRDKAKALEVYAHEAQNMEAERKACEIRIRAERRAGQILREMKESGQRRTPENGSPKKVSGGATLQDLGVTRDQSSKWQQLAEIPDAEFEKAVMAPGPKPSTEGMVNARIQQENPMPKVPSDAVFFWGRLRELERAEIFAKSPDRLIASMTEPMRDDVKRILPALYAWLERIGTDEQAE